jgi:hypothetical protein
MITNGKLFRLMAMKALKQEQGANFDAEIFEKAMAKAKRHMHNKYGGLDYALELGESGTSNVSCFYEETVKVLSGKLAGRSTFNHQTNDNFRGQMIRRYTR